MFRAFTLSFLLVMLTGPATAAEDPVYTGLLSNTGAGGYDVVSYFDTEQAVKGSSSHTTEYLGVTWRFASAENRAKFESNPEAYAPVYGGYCAWRSARATLPKVIPSTGLSGMASCT